MEIKDLVVVTYLPVIDEGTYKHFLADIINKTRLTIKRRTKNL